MTTAVSSDPKRGQLAPIETKLRGSLLDWRTKLEAIGHGIQEMYPPGSARDWSKDPILKGWHDPIYRLLSEMDSARADLQSVSEDLDAARKDAEYRAVLVSDWPTNHFLDRLSYLGTALFGAGGAAFVFGATFQDWANRFLPAIMLWGLGLVLLVYSLGGLSDSEQAKWNYFAKQFGVPKEFYPRMFNRKR